MSLAGFAKLLRRLLFVNEFITSDANVYKESEEMI